MKGSVYVMDKTLTKFSNTQKLKACLSVISLMTLTLNTDTHCKTLTENTALLESAWSSKLPHVPTVVAVATLGAQTGLAAFAAHTSASQSRDGGRRLDGSRNRWQDGA